MTPPSFSTAGASAAAAAPLASGQLRESDRSFQRLPYRLLRLGFDAASLAAAWRLSFELRLTANPAMSLAMSRAELAAAAPPLAWILGLWLAAALYRGETRRRPPERAAASLRHAAETALLVAGLTIVAIFFSHQAGAALSRSFPLLLAPVCFFALLTGRYVFLLVAALIESRWPSPERVALVGGRAARRLAASLAAARSPSFELCGVVTPSGVMRGDLKRLAAALESSGSKTLGDVSRLGEIINRCRLDRLIVVEEGLARRDAERCREAAEGMGVQAARLVEQRAGRRPRLESFHGVSLLALEAPGRPASAERLKRAIDVVGAALLLTLASPLMLTLAAAIRLSSPGPALYRSTRVGRGGRHFAFLKFRSMRRAAPRPAASPAEPVFKLRFDARVTPLGRWMRRWSLDELPQLINVLRGEMSLVGPRPLPAQDLDPDGRSRLFAEWSELRASTPPGLTGLWQINGRGDLEFEKWIEFDLAYVRSRSIKLDLMILAETPLAVVSGRGAY